MNNLYDFAFDLHHIQERINAFLSEQLDQIKPTCSTLPNAMRYGLLLGGKRIRPFLVYATGRMLGADLNQLDYAAAAIEAIHAYSLIHDDLPAMDNDTLRRGQPTCHITFDEATAILAGDALQSWAFEMITKATALSADQQLHLVKVLSQSAGVHGMCLGQSLDLAAEQKRVSLTELEQIHRHKTGALLTAALNMGFLCSPHYNDVSLQQQLIRYAEAIGLAFQVQDDILDVEGESAVLGKTVGADMKADKSTYPKLLGLNKAKQKAQELYHSALAELDNIPFDTTPLRAVAEFVITRKS